MICWLFRVDRKLSLVDLSAASVIRLIILVMKLYKEAESVTDLGVVFDQQLKFGLHIQEKVNKAYVRLGIIKINFKPIFFLFFFFLSLLLLFINNNIFILAPGTTITGN